MQKNILSPENNYRGISITRILTKFLECIIKCPELTNSYSNQFGYKTNYSTIHTSFLLKETIQHYKKNNTPRYICSLDVEKAFDWCNILFKQTITKY